jgi:nitroreductase
MSQNIKTRAGQPASPDAAVPLGGVPSLVRIAARAPSVHNTQPWRFCVHEPATCCGASLA